MHNQTSALVFSNKAKYIYIGRDGRNVLWSMYNHHSTANKIWYEALIDSLGRIGPPIEPPPSSITQYYHDWLDKNGHPWWPFWENVLTWWEIRKLSNVYLLHFANLKADMPGEIRKIAEFIETPIAETQWGSILDHCSFDYIVLTI